MTKIPSLLSLDDAPEDCLSRVRVPTVRGNAIFDALDGLLARPRTLNHAYGAALLGPARCGKTMLIREYLAVSAEAGVGGGSIAGDDGCDPDADNGGALLPFQRRPLRELYVELDPGTRLNSIARQFLQAMGDPSPLYGTQDQQTVRVHQILRGGRYDLVIVDEVHNLVDSDTDKVEQKAVHWLTALLNAGRTPVLLVGYDTFGSVIARNHALGGRLRPMPRLVPYRWNDTEDLNEFSFILSELEEAMELPAPSGLSESRVARRLCAATSGRLGYLEGLLSEARFLARRKRHSCIRQETLQEAVGSFASTWYQLPFNVFEVEDFGGAMLAFEAGTQGGVAPKLRRKRGSG